MQIFLIAAAAAVLAVFLLPLLDRVHNLATLSGTLFGAGMLAVGLLWERLGSATQRYTVFIIAAVLFVVPVFMERLFVFGRRQDDRGDVLIVLGCRVRGDIPSLALQKRVDAAFFFLQNNPEAVAVLSGGQGPDENLTEAACMKNMLTERGISAKRLFLEEHSTSTGTNIAFSLRVMEENDLSGRVVICTSEYHQYRANMLCRAHGIESGMISCATKPILLPTFLLRELMAVVKEHITM